MCPVGSPNRRCLKPTSYDVGTETLTVTFYQSRWEESPPPTGKPYVYQYLLVPEEVQIYLVENDYDGTWFNFNVRNSFEFIRIN
jgi:hypothetical protein